MKTLRFPLLLISAFMLLAAVQACNVVKQVTQTLSDIKRLQFKLDGVSGFQLYGVSLYDKSSISSFSIGDGLKLTQAFSSKRLPCDFVINVMAKNPNDGTAGSQSHDATITDLEWRLLIDDVPTIEGHLDHPVEVPGVGRSVQIPVRISLDLYQFFHDKGYDGMINTALSIGGVKGSPSHIKLDAKPTVNVGGMVVTYPGRITIIDKQYN